jgi:subtilisin family serine protease
MVILAALMVGWTSVARAENNRRIVMFLDGTPLWLQQLIVTLSGSQVVHTLSLINALAIELPLVGDVLDVVAILLENPAVIGVFDDPLVFADAITTVPAEDVPQEEIYDWGQDRIGVPTVHQHMPDLQGTGVKVAVLDTGADVDHPDLWQNIAGGYNAMRGGKWKPYRDDNGHGTHITGIIAARMNDLGIVGVAPQASIVVVKVLDENGAGYVSDLINGLQWVYAEQIKLVNMSLGFSKGSVPLERAIQRLHRRGVIMVASAGNRTVGSSTTEDGGGTDEGGGDEGEGTATACDTSADGGGADEGGGDEGENVVTACDTSAENGVRYPARYSEVLAVAATDYKDWITDYSLAGSEMDVAAPGGAMVSERILSTKWGGGYALGSGTSQATAHVTGCIALALQHNLDLSFSGVLDLLRETAWDLGYPEASQGAGLINVQKLVEALE